MPEVQASCADLLDPFNHLRSFPAWREERSAISRIQSQESMHEVIWQGVVSPKRTYSITESADLNPPSIAISDSSIRHSTSNMALSRAGQCCAMTSRPQALALGTRDANPKNARASTSQRSCRSPQSEQSESSAVAATSDFESDSGETTPTSGMPLSSTPDKAAPLDLMAPVAHRPSLTTLASNAQFSDVVSFPPLPARKATSDWYSPLPDIGAPAHEESCSLFDTGIGVNRGSLNARATITKGGRRSFIESAGISPSGPSRSSTAEPCPDYEVRRKSFLKCHPKAPARVGESFALGSSIGASSRERRRSSCKTLKRVPRVRTIDSKPDRQGTWSKWRPPSVCPPPKTPSPTELEHVGEQWLGSPQLRRNDNSSRILHGLEMESGHVDHLSPIGDRSPPLRGVDHDRIYDVITGTYREEGENTDEGINGTVCSPHACDDCKNDPRKPSVDWIG